ncbi:MAG: hypothetical protein ACR2P4_02380 [Gammaproteobacteria bacterium]
MENAEILIMALLAAGGLLFILPALAAHNGSGKSGGFGFLPAVIFAIGLLMGCGGGGGGGGGSSAGPRTIPAPPITTDGHRVEYWNVMLSDTNANMATLTVNTSGSANARYLALNGTSISATAPRSIISPGGSDHLNLTAPSYLQDITYTLSESQHGGFGGFGGVATTFAGTVVRERVYFVRLGRDCVFDGLAVTGYAGIGGQSRYQVVSCTYRSTSRVCIPPGSSNCLSIPGMRTNRVTIYKKEAALRRVCVQELVGVGCFIDYFSDGGPTGTPRYDIVLAFPDQTYRRDNGECESAPFYAVSNCQSENAVDVGNFAAFVTGLDGGGYRQFGVRHKWKAEDWNAAAMVSHAKGREFLDTWWGRLRLEHSVLDDGMAFAEYESGITSLRQNGFMFADIPISGGRVGFRFNDWTASFGRPMHFDGKGKNAAAVHWQATKQTEFQFRSHNDTAEFHLQYRREL